MAKTIVVKNAEELKKANSEAKPGDIIVLQNGEWKQVIMSLTCSGTKERPITFKAQTPGKVLITGNSKLRIGGDFIIVDGLYFIRGYAGDDAVIRFSIDKNQIANNCRVTNTLINDFNNPKRMDENYWVAFYGKNNRVDHCSFLNKKNMGVLLAVILDDEKSRENFHSIDHNYFGVRLPLASNTGEIIRVGVSQHAEFNSNTQITENFFDNCDGETEIVSIKSGSNVIRNNLFKECQGSVVLRHGDNNTVENNIFLGNDKNATGGVRVINKGQWVINNFFYKCRGTDFRSPLAVMNGIPNSPAHRYVQVTDAVIVNNTFYNCSPISFGEGSDTERSLPPDNVILANNIFYNYNDSIIYKVFDDIKGFSFLNNEISKEIKQDVARGFIKASLAAQKNDIYPFPVSLTVKGYSLPDSLQQQAKKRIGHELSSKAGFSDLALIKKIQANAYYNTGAQWFNKSIRVTMAAKTAVVNCATAAEVYTQLDRNEPSTIKLTGKEYTLDRPFIIANTIRFTGNNDKPIFINSSNMQSVFVISGNGSLALQDVNIDGNGVKATHFISNDSSGRADHYNLSIKNCLLSDFKKENGCQSLVYAYKYMVADSFVISNNSFLNNSCNAILMVEEKDDKGYYNAEKIFIRHNSFSSQNGAILNIYRGGNDESTLGPDLVFSHNNITNCNSDSISLISLTGVQQSAIFSNQFTSSNSKGTLLRYYDIVRARHLLEKNIFSNSGRIEANSFVTQKDNSIK